MAEGVGFEPTGPCGPPVFKTGAIDHSATPPFEAGRYLHPFDRLGKQIHRAGSGAGCAAEQGDGKTGFRRVKWWRHGNWSADC